MFLFLLIYLLQNNLLAQDLFIDPGSSLSIPTMSKEKENTNKCYQKVSGYIIDGVAYKTIGNAQIRLFSSFDETLKELKSNNNGYFQFTASCDASLQIEATHSSYNTRYRRIIFNRSKDSIYFKIYLNPAQREEKTKFIIPFIEAREIPYKSVNGINIIDIPKIYFDWDQPNFDDDSKPILDQLIPILKANPKLMLEIASHTDARGYPDYNLDLSQKRAEKIKQYLIQKEIDPYRLIAMGYGGKRPLNNCIERAKCTNEQHLENRRTEFVILNPF